MQQSPGFPLWATLVIAGMTGLIGLIGTFALLTATLKINKNADKWRRREETMRMIQWAVDQSAEGSAKIEAAHAMLRALAESDVLQPEDDQLLETVASNLLAGSAEEYREDGFTEVELVPDEGDEEEAGNA